MLRNTLVGSSKGGRYRTVRIHHKDLTNSQVSPYISKTMQSRRVKGTGQVVSMEEKKTSWRSLKERATLENLGIDGKIPHNTG